MTRKLTDVNDLESSSMQPRNTRPRLEIEPLDFGIQLPGRSSPAPPTAQINKDQDSLHHDTELTLYFTIPPPTAEAVDVDQDSNPETELTMFLYLQESQSQSQTLPQIPPPPKPDNPLEVPIIHVPPPTQPQPVVVAKAAGRTRRRPTHTPREGKSATIQPPFPWATDRRAQVHTLKHLTENGIETVSGDVQCKRCQKQYQIQYNLEEKFKEVSEYVVNNDFKDRAPDQWMTPMLPTCDFCHQENSVKPVMNKKKSINWLFLLLGQMLGCCKLAHLKYFCKHTGNHRTGAKNRVLFLTYLGLCKQVDPDGPYDHDQYQQQQHLYPLSS